VVPADYYYPICESTFIIFCNLGFEKLQACSDGSGSKIFDPTLGQPSMVWVWIWKISPKKMSNFSLFFPSGQKVLGLKAGQPLIYCGLKISSGRIRSRPTSTGMAGDIIVLSWVPLTS